ncbi:uroporphyrinogen-III C-methyltransferase [Nigerium massiliense]|uniref:uroporphyrinogen-III C-methyltransferase n=1 Tax=Nigerium massiliense TaxID=1522317 RepID=UPI00058FC117|nr:uroporphyrinogen-III C-methyltransferase [Nigerium massiliense]
MNKQLSPGTVVLVGGGPGDADLLTVAGMRAVRQADVILYDRLAPQDALAEARPDAELVPVGKWPRGEYTPQEEINRLLVEHARAGRRVVRLKGGDNTVFGRGGEEAQACVAAGVPVEFVPGVTSAVAAPQLAGIPVTHRSLSQGFTVVSGHVPPGDARSQLDWGALARTRTTLVILMGVKYLPEITATLRDAGLDPTTPAAIVMAACMPGSQTLRGTVSSIADIAGQQGVTPPAITVIGDVAALDLTDADLAGLDA